MSRGIIEAQTLRTEQFEFEGRTSDPTDAQPGEYWIRTDQTSTNPDVIAELRRQDTSGVTTCPIFAAAEESNLGTDVTRGPSVVLSGGSVGFVAMTTGSGAVGSPRAVNSAGTQYVSHNALELSPIPDSAMFQSPLYQFWAGGYGGNDGDSPAPFVEQLAGLSDASAVGDPTFRVDQSDDTNSWDSYEYDGSGDAHDWTSDSDIPTGASPFSWACLAWFQNVDQNIAIASYGNDATNEANFLTRTGNGLNNAIQHVFFDNDLIGNSSIPSGEWVTIGMRYDGSNRKLYLNGNGDGSDSPGSVNIQDANHSIGYEAARSQSYMDGYIAEVILCDTAESDQAFADYHTDRLG